MEFVNCTPREIEIHGPDDVCVVFEPCGEVAGFEEEGEDVAAAWSIEIDGYAVPVGSFRGANLRLPVEKAGCGFIVSREIAFAARQFNREDFYFPHGEVHDSVCEVVGYRALARFSY